MTQNINVKINEDVENAETLDSYQRILNHPWVYHSYYHPYYSETIDKHHAEKQAQALNTIANSFIELEVQGAGNFPEQSWTYKDLKDPPVRILYIVFCILYIRMLYMYIVYCHTTLHK